MENLEKLLSILKEWKNHVKGFNSLTLSNDGVITISNDGDYTYIKLTELIWLNNKVNSVNSNWEVGSIFPPSLGDTEESLTIFIGFIKKPKDEDFIIDWDKEISQSWEI